MEEKRNTGKEKNKRNKGFPYKRKGSNRCKEANKEWEKNNKQQQ